MVSKHTKSSPQPLLKWVGGKSQLMHEIIPLFPSTMNQYHEPFLGGASVLLSLLHKVKEGKIHIQSTIYASDSNKALIYFYKHVQNNPVRLYHKIQTFCKIYNSIQSLNCKYKTKPKSLTDALQSKEAYYYWIREQYCNLKQLTSVSASAMFYMLNKLCFRGLYRENKQGKFNVSFGNYVKAPQCSCADFEHISELIQHVQFCYRDFHKSFKHIHKGDFIYLDPPYVPESNTSFVNYNKTGFTHDMHERLFDDILKANKTGARFVLSNANVSMVDHFSVHNKFHTKKVNRIFNRIFK